MKIDNSVKSVSPLGGGEARTRATGAPAQPAAPPGAQVQLSALAGQMERMEGLMAETPVVDGARVAQIRQAIAEGRFEINPEKIADGLIASVREMLERNKS